MTRTELTSQLLLFILFSWTTSNYVRVAWNRAKSHMRLTSRRLFISALCYRPGSPNYGRGPNAALEAISSVPRSHFVINGKTIYLRNVCWFGRVYV